MGTSLLHWAQAAGPPRAARGPGTDLWLPLCLAFPSLLHWVAHLDLKDPHLRHSHISTGLPDHTYRPTGLGRSCWFPLRGLHSAVPSSNASPRSLVPSASCVSVQRSLSSASPSAPEGEGSAQPCCPPAPPPGWSQALGGDLLGGGPVSYVLGELSTGHPGCRTWPSVCHGAAGLNAFIIKRSAVH